MNLVFWVLLFSIIASLLLYAYFGIFTRYMADDYCTAAALKTRGFLGAQTYWWQHWSGRYSFTFLVSLVELFGLRIIPILPAFIMCLWLVSIVWVCLPFLREFKIENPILSSVFIAGLLLWLTYQSVSDYPQIMFWQTGILTYPVSPILFLSGVGIAVRRARNPASISRLELLFWFLFAFIMGGFSETGVAIQISLLALFLLFVQLAEIQQKKIVTAILLTALCGSILSLLLILLAPGNAVRSQGFKDIPPLGGSLPGSFMESLVLIPKWINNHTATAVLGFLCGVFWVWYCVPDELRASNSLILKLAAASFIVVEVGIWAGIAPAYILRGGVPPERVLLFSFFLIAGLAVCWGMLTGTLLRTNLHPLARVFGNWILPGLLIFLILWELTPFLNSQWNLISPLRTYSMVWDQRQQTLLAASQNNPSPIVVADITRIEGLHKLRTKLWLTGDFEDNPNYWVNRCAAEYYQVRQITAQ
jgi:hypothetical protein